MRPLIRASASASTRAEGHPGDALTIKALRALHEAVGELYEAVSDRSGGASSPGDRESRWRASEPLQDS